MEVKVEVLLTVSAAKADKGEMFEAATILTNDYNSINVHVPKGKPKTIVAEFSINKARQIDVVDQIFKEFRYSVRNHNDTSISFPKKSSAKRSRQKKNKYTPKQGQYLSFIYYYTKLNGYPPAEADMQRFFKTAPTTIHSMILQLEKKNLIERTPRKPRSIKLLLHRDEIPDLE